MAGAKHLKVVLYKSFYVAACHVKVGMVKVLGQVRSVDVRESSTAYQVNESTFSWTLFTPHRVKVIK